MCFPLCLSFFPLLLFHSILLRFCERGENPSSSTGIKPKLLLLPLCVLAEAMLCKTVGDPIGISSTPLTMSSCDFLGVSISCSESVLSEFSSSSFSGVLSVTACSRSSLTCKKIHF